MTTTVIDSSSSFINTLKICSIFEINGFTIGIIIKIDNDTRLTVFFLHHNKFIRTLQHIAFWYGYLLSFLSHSFRPIKGNLLKDKKNSMTSLIGGLKRK